METSLVYALVSAASAIFGAGVTAVMQWQLARVNNRAQLQLQADRMQHELAQTENDYTKNQAIEIHKTISSLTRHFSLTAIDINVRSAMTEEAFDQHYWRFCDALDEARALVDLNFSAASEPIESMNGQMSIFWGNCKEILRLSQLNETYERKKPFYQSSIEAGRAIANEGYRIKAELARHLRNARV
jgi:hypothetical protein